MLVPYLVECLYKGQLHVDI
uniref:Uncharacterized protein n=1 Tax=Arundo donax TaxID=35708 RepID=A0A0A9BNP6_ARUDO